VAAIRSPLAAGNSGQISKNGRAALVTFQITGNADTAQNRVGAALAATTALQRAYPRLFVGELGAASTLKAVNTEPILVDISASHRAACVSRFRCDQQRQSAKDRRASPPPSTETANPP
jgi:hypothetical protein